MKKFLLTLLKLFGILFGVFLLLVLFFVISIQIRRKEQQEKLEVKLKECDTLINVTRRPLVSFYDFKTEEIDTLQFQLIRHGQVLRDSTFNLAACELCYTNGLYHHIKLPFMNFKITDTIQITTKMKLHYYISNFKHTAGQFYGMFGPVAVSECELAEDYTINNLENTNAIYKVAGWEKSKINAFRRFIPSITMAFDSIAHTLPVTDRIAYDICKNRVKNPTYATYIVNLGLEQINTDFFYLFTEVVDIFYDDYHNKQYSHNYIRINAKTVTYQRFTEYPVSIGLID